MMSVRISAPYLEWAKTRPAATFDLAGSNILACSIGDLPGAAEAIGLEGKNDEGYMPLIDAIAQHYGVGTDRVTTAQGASGANFLACAALLEPGDDVLVETPGYDPLFAAPRLLGARVNCFERGFDDGFSLNPDRVRLAMTPQTRVVIVTSPHNPSGVVASRESLAEIGRIARENGAHVLVDEVYSDVAAGSTSDAAPRGGTAADLPGPFVCTNSLTKSYGLSGLRCGWIVSSADVASRIRRARDVVDGSGSIVAERLAVHAFNHLDRLLARATAILEANSAMVWSFLRSRSELEWISGTGTVVFPRLRGAEDSSRFAERLLAERDTAIVPGRFFQAPRHFRLGFGGDSGKLRAGLEALGAALDARAWT
jgi:aspartate/methionine/tyrosine aminotransferase